MANNPSLFNAVIAGCSGSQNRWITSHTAADYLAFSQAAAALATEIDGLIPATVVSDSEMNLLQGIVNAVLTTRMITSMTAADYSDIAQSIVALFTELSAQLVADAGPGILAVNLGKSANQSLNDGSLDEVTWDVVTYDTGAFYNVANPTRVTAPVTGKYHLTCVLAYNLEDTDGYRQLNYKKNGAGSVLCLTTMIATIGTPARLCGSLDIQLTAGDYLEILGLQNSGSAVTIGGGAGSDTFLAMYLIGA